MAAILTVDDEDGVREFIADALTESGHDVVQAANAAEALVRLDERPFDVMICDLRMPGELNGMDVVRRARAARPDMQVVVLTAHGSVGTAVEAMRIGAFDFLEKPIAGPTELRSLVARALTWRTARVHPEPVAQAEPVSEPASTSKVQRLLRELKRRHVYNVTVTYAVAAFIVLQLAELVLPAMPWAPAWTYSAVIVLLIVGFIVAIVLGWVYDITSRGVKRTR